jgi:DNA mismatch endonuclease (patch repair protein)
MDTLNSAERSKRMGLVRGKDTKPEMLVRRMVHAMGFRYRLHVKTLPGSPDMVFPGRGKIIFIHGCFWHRHGPCKNTRLPKSRLDFWLPKLEGNRARDAANRRLLRRLGWEVLVIWECQLKNLVRTAEKINMFLRREP